MSGEQRQGAALGKISAVVWVVGTFGDCCGGGTLGLSIPISTPSCAVLEGVGGDRSSGVAILGGGLKATLGGGAVWWRGRGLMGDTTLNFCGGWRVS